MSAWDEEFIDEEEGCVEFGQEDDGQFDFGCVQGRMDCRLTTRDGEARRWMELKIEVALGDELPEWDRMRADFAREREELR